MRRFAQLCEELDQTTSTRAKTSHLIAYLREAPADDAAWGLYLLAGGRPPRAISTTALREAAAHAAGLPEWLFEASYQAVGDLAETIAHLIDPQGEAPDLGLAQWMQQRMLPLKEAPADTRVATLMGWLREQPWSGRFILIKLLSGGFRLGVSRALVLRAVAEHAGLDPAVVAQRMVGWTDRHHQPSAASLQALMAPVSPDAAAEAPWRQGRPWPFFLAQPWPDLDPASPEAPLGPVHDWLVEWKFDGIRAQVVKHQGQVWIWSRGEELISETFPDVVAACQPWPDGTVLDGELLLRETDPKGPRGHDAPVIEGGTGHDPTPEPASALIPGLAWRPAPFARLQQRLGRKTQSKALLASHPAVFLAYDALVWQGEDLRALPQQQRRERLTQLVAPVCNVTVSPALQAPDWAHLAAQRQQARALGVEGLMLKHRDCAYGIGRSKASGLWWKWKLDPLTIDAVLLYAQAGHGRRASLYTDYTFALWSRPPENPEEVEAVRQAIAAGEAPTPQGLRLVTIAKAYSGLSDAEIREVDRIVRRDTVNKFGPVRSVVPSLVFELGFEGMARSPRHRSGYALRFPRILRWRTDKPLHEADTLASLAALEGGTRPAPD